MEFNFLDTEKVNDKLYLIFQKNNTIYFQVEDLNSASYLDDIKSFEKLPDIDDKY